MVARKVKLCILVSSAVLLSIYLSNWPLGMSQCRYVGRSLPAGGTNIFILSFLWNISIAHTSTNSV